MWEEFIKMIFVTLGSQKFQFNRLLKAIDGLEVEEEIFAQIGYSDYIPVNYSYKTFLDRNEFNEIMDKASIVITHGGTGAIVGAIKKGKKVIAVPRLAKYGEHVDDHQLQIIHQFESQNLICGLSDCGKLQAGLEFARKHKFSEYHSNTNKIIDSIERYLIG